MIVTYTSIKPLITKEELVGGSQLYVTFHADGMAAPIQAVGMMMADQQDMMKNVQKQAVKQGFISIIISTISRVLGSLIGGVGGSVASSAASTVGYGMTSGSMNSQSIMSAKDTPENREKAAVAAFQTIQQFFEYDAASGLWKGKSNA